MIPDMKSTWCFFSISSATCTPTSVFCWSSPKITSVSSPPTFLPRWSSAISTESFMCLPIPPVGPDSVVMKPIFSFCCAMAGEATSAAAARSRNIFFTIPS
jgi:hypothetical protein